MEPNSDGIRVIVPFPPPGCTDNDRIKLAPGGEANPSGLPRVQVIFQVPE